MAKFTLRQLPIVSVMLFGFVCFFGAVQANSEDLEALPSELSAQAVVQPDTTKILKQSEASSSEETQQTSDSFGLGYYGFGRGLGYGYRRYGGYGGYGGYGHGFFPFYRRGFYGHRGYGFGYPGYGYGYGYRPFGYGYYG